MFDLLINRKVRGCDIIKVKIGDLVSGGKVRSRVVVVHQKTGRPVQFELLESARASILTWLECREGSLDEFCVSKPGRSCRPYQYPAICPAG
jgi:hypothetical protein